MKITTHEHRTKMIVGGIAVGAIILLFALRLAPSKNLGGNLRNAAPAKQATVQAQVTPARCYDVATAFKNGVNIPGESEACRQRYPHIWNGVVNPPSEARCSEYAAWYRLGRLTDTLGNNQSQWNEVLSCRVAYPELGL